MAGFGARAVLRPALIDHGLLRKLRRAGRSIIT
jgi:hypothetical protein